MCKLAELRGDAAAGAHRSALGKLAACAGACMCVCERECVYVPCECISRVGMKAWQHGLTQLGRPLHRAELSPHRTCCTGSLLHARPRCSSRGQAATCLHRGHERAGTGTGPRHRQLEQQHTPWQPGKQARTPSLPPQLHKDTNRHTTRKKVRSRRRVLSCPFPLTW